MLPDQRTAPDTTGRSCIAGCSVAAGMPGKEEEEPIMDLPKYKTCKHSTGEYGQTAVYVHPSCPRLTMIKGILVSSKRRCKECRSWEEKDDAKMQ